MLESEYPAEFAGESLTPVGSPVPCSYVRIGPAMAHHWLGIVKFDVSHVLIHRHPSL